MENEETHCLLIPCGLNSKSNHSSHYQPFLVSQQEGKVKFYKTYKGSQKKLTLSNKNVFSYQDNAFYHDLLLVVIDFSYKKTLQIVQNALDSGKYGNLKDGLVKLCQDNNLVIFK